MVGMRDMAAIFEARHCCERRVEGNKPALSKNTAFRRSPATGLGSRRKCAQGDFRHIERRPTLTGVRRQAVDWHGRLGRYGQGDSEAGLRAYAEHDRIEMVAGREAAQARAIKAWQDLRQLMATTSSS